MKRWVPYAVFAALTLAVFWPVLVLGRTMMTTSPLEQQLGRQPLLHAFGFIPRRRPTPFVDNVLLLPVNQRIYNEGLRHGELRLWNPYLFCGFPSYANALVFWAYPPQMIAHLLLPPIAAFDALVMAHFLLSGCAMYWALLALGRSPPAATIGGIVWMLCGYHAQWLVSTHLMAATVFGPLALLGIARAMESRDVRHAALAGMAMGLTILGSHPQRALHLFLLFTAIFAARRQWRLGLWFCLSAVGIGTAMALTQLDAISGGFRNPGADHAAIYAEPWAAAANASSLLFRPVGMFGESGAAFEFASHLGLAVLTLAFTAAIALRRDPWVRLFSIAGLLLLIVVYVAPVASAANVVPVLNFSVAPRWLFAVAFCASVLCAFGLDAFPRCGSSIGPGIVAGGYALACSAGIGDVVWLHPAAAGVAIGFAFAFGAAFVATRHPARAPLAFGIAIVFELLPFFLLLNRSYDSNVLDERPEALAVINESEPWRGAGAFSSMNDLAVGSNVLAYHGVEGISGFESSAPWNYLLYAQAAGAAAPEVGRGVYFAEFESPLIDLMNVKYVFMPFGWEMPPRYRVVARWGGLTLYENPTVVARATVVSHVIYADDDAARYVLQSDTVVIAGAGDEEPGGRVPARIEWVDRTPGRCDLDVTSDAPGILVIADGYDAGWEATVDGEPVEVLRANIAFRGIRIDAGRHEVRMRYRPESVRTGGYASLAFGAVAVLMAFGRRRATMEGGCRGSSPS